MGTQARAGVAWLTALNFFQEALQFGVMLALVRILNPRFYGEFSLANSFIGFVTVLSFRSFAEHSLQIRDPEKPDYQTLFTIGGIFQAAAVTILNLIAFALRLFPAYEPIAPVLHVMSVFFVLDWMSELRVKMLERSMSWARLRLLHAIGLVAGGAASIVLAMAGGQVYALVLPSIIVTLPFIADLFLGQHWRPDWTCDRAGFRATFRYGLTRIGSGMAIRIQQLLEGTVVVAMAGFAEYGVYGRAVGLASLAGLRLASLLTVALMPVLTRLPAASARYRNAAAVILRVVGWTSVPVAGLGTVFARPLIHLLYGSKWDAVIPLLPWALVAAALTAFRQTGMFLLLANMQPRSCLTSDLLMLAGTPVSLFLFLPRGIRTYLVATCGILVLSLCHIAFCLIRSSALDMRGIRLSVVPPALAVSLPAAGFFLLHGAYTPSASLAMSAVAAPAAALMYLVSLRVFWSNSLRELLDQMPGSSYLRAAMGFSAV